MEIATKLNIKPGMTVAVIDCPHDVTLDLGEDVTPATEETEASAVVVFAINHEALNDVEGALVGAAKADRIAWLAYPKGAKLGTDLNRDILWEELAAAGIRPVRQVSIDATWSAIRFRPAESDRSRSADT